MNRPLLDAVVVTREHPDAGRWVEGLRRYARKIFSIPCVHRRFLPPSGESRSEVDKVIHEGGPSDVAFASRYAVAGFVRWLDGLDKPLPASTRLWAVGPATAAAVTEAFGRCEPISAPFEASELARRLMMRRPPPRQVWLPAAREPRDVLRQALHQARVVHWPMAVYVTDIGAAAEAILPPLSPRSVIVFASPSAVAGFFSRWPRRADFVALALGPVTAQALKQASVSSMAICPEASWAGVLRWFDAQSL